MSFSFKPLWRLLLERDINKNYLRDHDDLKLSPATVAKMGKNENVSLEIIDKLCSHFEVQPNDIIEHKTDESSNE